MIHVFDTEHARLYGMAESVIIANFQFWIGRNKANGENLREGRTWTYNTVRALSQLFPYLSGGQIRRALDSLVEQGVLLTGIFNERAVDRTKWYAFNDECKFLAQQMDLPKTANATDAGDKTLIEKDITTDVNQDTGAAAPRSAKPSRGAVERTPKFDPLAALQAEGVPERAALDWLKVRKDKRLPLTQTALDAIVAQAGKARLPMAEVVRLCCTKGWAGFEADWVAPKSAPPQHPAGTGFARGVANADAAKALIFGGDHAAA